MDIPKLGGAAALAILAGVLWFALIRRSPPESAVATILTKGYMAGSTYTQQPVGANRGFNTPNTIQIAEANTFDPKIDGIADTVRVSFNTVKSRQIEVGQRVRIQYVRRSLPPVWSRLTVVEMMPDSAP